MARTRLFDRLLRTFRLAHLLEQRGISTQEGLERIEAARASRRRFLQLSGAAGATLLAGRTLSACGPGTGTDGGTDVTNNNDAADGMTSRTDARIVVVGAGLAGLVAAYRLGQRGFRPRVFDANNRVGGRVFSERMMFVSKIELGGELIDTDHETTRNLATELGLTVLDQEAAVSMYERERYYIGGVAYTEMQILEQFRPVATMLARDLMAMGMDFATYNAFTPTAQMLDRLSITQWMDMNGVTGAIRTLLEMAYTSEYGREVSEQSFLNLLYLIGLEDTSFRVFGASDEKFTIREGNDAMTTELSRRLPVPVELEHRLVAVRPRSDGALTVVFDRNGTSIEHTADRLVLALPFTQLRNVELMINLSMPKRAAIMQLRYGTNSKLMVGTSTRPWYTAMRSGTTFNDQVYHESWESSRGYPGTAGVLTSFTGGALGVGLNDGTPDTQAQRFLDRLDLALPGVRAAYNGVAARFHWPSARHFEGSYACYAPGQYTSIRGAEGEVEGNVHFAGEHTSLDWQGFMNGAVESGDRVAEEIATALG